MNWMKKHVPAKNSDVYIQVLDAMFINAVRGKPEYPMQFANRISDVVQRVSWKIKFGICEPEKFKSKFT